MAFQSLSKQTPHEPVCDSLSDGTRWEVYTPEIEDFHSGGTREEAVEAFHIFSWLTVPFFPCTDRLGKSKAYPFSQPNMTCKRIRHTSAQDFVGGIMRICFE